MTRLHTAYLPTVHQFAVFLPYSTSVCGQCDALRARVLRCTLRRLRRKASTYHGLQVALPSGGVVQNSARSMTCFTTPGALKQTVDPTRLRRRTHGHEHK